MKKRLLTVMLAVCLTMTGCAQQAQDVQENVNETDTAEGESAVGGGKETEVAEGEQSKTSEAPEGEQPEIAKVPGTEQPEIAKVPGTEQPKTAGAPEGEQSKTSEEQEEAAGHTVTYDADGVYMQVTLPKAWSYEILTPEMIRTDGMESCMIRYWLTEEPDVCFELAYWSSFGICGTGVTMTQIELDSGLGATRFTEVLDGEVWFSTCVEKPEGSSADGSYVISADIEEEYWNQHEEEMMDIVRSVVVK